MLSLFLTLAAQIQKRRSIAAMYPINHGFPTIAVTLMFLHGFLAVLRGAPMK
jgi:hypothetical protein